MAGVGAAAPAHVNGMFAAAVWDASRRVFTCARDRVGIKPLYDAVRGDLVLIGSEIKAILAGLDHIPAPEWPIVLDYVASRITDHTQSTFFEGIRQVPPGGLLVVAEGQARVLAWDALDPADDAAALTPHRPARLFTARSMRPWTITSKATPWLARC